MVARIDSHLNKTPPQRAVRRPPTKELTSCCTNEDASSICYLSVWNTDHGGSDGDFTNKLWDRMGYFMDMTNFIWYVVWSENLLYT
jgi:hypothetical protein